MRTHAVIKVDSTETSCFTQRARSKIYDKQVGGNIIWQTFGEPNVIAYAAAGDDKSKSLLAGFIYID